MGAPGGAREEMFRHGMAHVPMCRTQRPACDGDRVRPSRMLLLLGLACVFCTPWWSRLHDIWCFMVLLNIALQVSTSLSCLGRESNSPAALQWG